jgi:hypothetical protein
MIRLRFDYLIKLVLAVYFPMPNLYVFYIYLIYVIILNVENLYPVVNLMLLHRISTEFTRVTLYPNYTKTSTPHVR